MTIQDYCFRAVLVYLVLGLVSCADTAVRYDRPVEVDLSADSPRYEAIRQLAKQTGESGHKLVAEGQRKLRAAQARLLDGEKMVAAGQRRAESATAQLSAQALQEAADQVRAGNAQITDSRRAIEVAQNNIREGRRQIEVAAEILRGLNPD